MMTGFVTETLREILGWLEHCIGLTLLNQPLEILLGKIERAGVNLGYQSIEEFCTFLHQYKAEFKYLPEEHFQTLVDHLTVTETFFFRGQAVLEHIVEEKLALDDLLQGKISIWSAACATGEEPYTLAMLIAAKYPFLVWSDLKPPIVATDINRRALEKAKAGIYHHGSLSFRSMPQEYLRFFERLPGDFFRVKPEIKRFVDFRWTNLLCEETGPPGEFDICLLRNVLYYFNETLRQNVIENVRKRLKPGGILVLGETEQLRHEIGFQVVLTPKYFYYVKDADETPAERTE
ncbi:MAG: protein-glutamate O-methyltransferase CheR [Firmicutes bacterium]|nr:protein-glutamate O-methyltransferase CheR [Bacillota bacterium]